jgi:hypothetical protein
MFMTEATDREDACVGCGKQSMCTEWLLGIRRAQYYVIVIASKSR